MDLLEAANQYYEYLKALDRSPKTIENYKGHLQRLNTCLTAKYNRLLGIDEIIADDLEKYLFAPPNDKKFSQVTRRDIIKTYKAFFSFCCRNGHTKTNITTKLPHIQANPKERISINEDELLNILEFIPKETDKAFIQTLFYAGLRIGEAVQLTLEDVNIHDNCLYIRKYKSKDDRKVPISFKLGVILYNYIENCRPETESKKAFIFTQNHPTCIQKYINARLREASLQAGQNIPITSHIMRHSFASNLIAKGVNIVNVQKLLGHKSLKMTNIYLHAHIDTLKKTVNTL